MQPDDQKSDSMLRQSRLGLKLFALYTSFYAAFVFLNAFAPSVMETMVVDGLNLAIVYGFALIVAAIVLAMIYGWLCHDNDSVAPPSDVETASSSQDAEAAK